MSVHVCVHKCVCKVDMARLQVDALYFSLQFSNLFLKQSFLPIELGAHQLVRLDGWHSLGWDPYLCLPALDVWDHTHLFV